MTLTPAFLDELRARTTLSALVGKSVKLTRAGREHKGCCPFHNEKTPSFYVNDDKGFYHCFGCSAHGDAIRWMTDQRGLPFIDAVKELAQTAGLDMPAPDARAAEKQERAKGLHEACQAAADWFEQQLGGLDGGEAVALLRKRGINDETRRRFNLGYTPDTRGRLRTALRDFGDATLVEAGLLIQVEGKEPYDRFRGRLTIPIRDPRGRVIAFGARIIGEGEPKYLNSPDTPLFDKGRTLFNLDRAAPAARKAGRLLVVEGYLDVIALAQAGIDEAVAPLGTALTEAQLERLWRVHDRPVLCLDGDSAGQKAATRTAYRALPLLNPGQTLTFAPLPQGQDPDDVIRNGGASAFEDLLAHPTPLLHTIFVNERSQSSTESPEGRAGLRASLAALAGTIRNPLVKDEYSRAFNGLFYDEFGWKKAERNAIGRSIIRTGPHGDRNAFRMFVRSALYGLSRFPTEISYAMEPVSGLRLRNEDLSRWRDNVLEAGLRVRHLDSDAVISILDTRVVSAQTARDLRSDLRFQWNIERELAIHRLRGLIDFLKAEQEVDERMAELNARLVAEHGLDDYDEIEAERIMLRAERKLLIDMGYELGLDPPKKDDE